MGRFTERFKARGNEQQTQTVETTIREPSQQFVSPGVSPEQQKGAVIEVNTPMGRFTQRSLGRQKEPELGFWEGIKDSLTGASRRTEETEKLPEIMGPGSPLYSQFKARSPMEIGEEDIAKAKAMTPEQLQKQRRNLTAAAGFLLATDEEDLKSIAEGVGVQTRKDEKGNLIGTYDGKDFVLNKPGFSLLDAQQSLADMAAFMPAGVFAGLGKGLMGRIALGGAGMAASEYAIGEAREMAGAEEQPLSEAGMAGGVEAAAEVIPPAIGKAAGPVGRLATRAVSAIPAVGEPVARLASEAGEKIKVKMSEIVDAEAHKMLKRSQKLEEGVPLGILGPQASEVPSDLVALRVLHEQPATSRAMSAIDQVQDKAGKREFYKFLARLGKSPSFEKGAKQFKEAAEKITVRLKEERKKHTDALYGSIFADPADVDINQVVGMIDTKLTKYPSQKSSVRKKLEDVKDLIIQKKEQVQLYDAQGNLISTQAIDTSPIEILHNARKEISDMIEKSGPEGLTGTTKKELVEVKKALSDAMYGADPRYKEVTDLYRELSIPIKDLEETIVGKGVKLKHADLQRMSEIMFNPKKVKPGTLRALKTVIDEIDPSAFGSLLRAKLESQLRAIPDVLGQARSGKKAKVYSVGEIYGALSKSEGEAGLIKAVLTKDQAKNFTYLKEQLRKASLGRSGGSDTTIKTTFIEKLKGTVAGAIISVAAPLYAFGSVGAGLSGARMLSSKVKDATLDKRLGYLYEAILDPKWSNDMARIRKMDPQTPAAGRAFAQLINNIESRDEREISPGVTLAEQREAIKNVK